VTLIANHVDLPGHPAIVRRPARQVDDSDRDLSVTVALDRSRSTRSTPPSNGAPTSPGAASIPDSRIRPS
jgi:hypothetical protein